MDSCFQPPDNIMRYILYDLREDPSLVKVHLPRAEDDEPVLLRVEPDQYNDVRYELRELCINEGDEWMVTLLQRPDYAPTNTGDLIPNALYILIAHFELFKNNPNEFRANLARMKKLVFH